MTASANRLRLHDASIRLDSMPASGRDLDLTVGEEERQQIASLLEVQSVDALRVKLHAVRFRGGIRVTGRLDATLTQASVVSLDPVSQTVGEPIDRVFLPGGEKDYAGPANAEIFVDLDGDDVPDHFEGNEADLTDLIVETLALGIDPYPRLPGESLDNLGLTTDEDPHPFAALRKLKTDLDES